MLCGVLCLLWPVHFGGAEFDLHSSASLPGLRILYRYFLVQLKFALGSPLRAEHLQLQK